MVYIKRLLEDKIRNGAKSFPVIALIGPRQAGKTTLAKNIFTDYLYVNLELPETRQFAKNDPKTFLLQSKKMIIDEIQNVPKLFSYIQVLVDEDKEKKFVISGSSNFNLLKKVSQSLAGRVGLFDVLPFSLLELKDINKNNEISDFLIKDGLFPRVVIGESDANIWYQSYIQTYIEKDVRLLSDIELLDKFYVFIKSLSMRVGGVLNYTNISQEVGVAVNTIKKWVKILEASFIIYLLKPYTGSRKGQIIKSPKVFFCDTGLLCSLLGITDAEELRSDHNFGNIFENFVIMETVKYNNLNNYSRLFFYRNSEGKEIDLIIENTKNLSLIEIKTSNITKTEFTQSIENVEKKIKGVTDKSIFYRGKENYALDKVNYISNIKGIEKIYKLVNKI
jgi:predicted AAA+ superfamily ATPase